MLQNSKDGIMELSTMVTSAGYCRGVISALIVLGLAVGSMLWLPGQPSAQDICSGEAKDLMRRAGIREEKIAKACALATRNGALLSISLKRREEALGYCQVTLALHNNTNQYLNQLSMPSRHGRFEIFRFHNIQPGRTGYAAAKSRILLACDELEETAGITFLWPASLRIGDRHPTGSRLERYKPKLLGGVIRWSK
jgi:hypothetical protein